MTKTASEEATEENPSISKHQQWRKSLPKLARLTKNLRAKGNLPELALLSEILAYSAIFSYFSVQKFREFSIYAWDFGVYSQAISTTLTSGTLFYSTLELPYTQTVIPAGTQQGWDCSSRPLTSSPPDFKESTGMISNLKHSFPHFCYLRCYTLRKGKLSQLCSSCCSPSRR